MESQSRKTETAYFASGCFWGTEYYLNKADGVIKTTVGYMGGTTEHPTYEQVCTGTTSHAETVRVEYDPGIMSYEDLVKLFFETHNPTQRNRQGPDIGSQYRSAIFYANNEQKRIAEKIIQILKDKGMDIVTELTPAGPFWPAEDRHQMYYARSKGFPYCHIYRKLF